MGMALPLEVRLEEKRGVDFGLHDDGAGSGEPKVELLGPGAVEDSGGSEHGALDGEAKRSGGKIGWGDGSRHKDLCFTERERAVQGRCHHNPGL